MGGKYKSGSSKICAKVDSTSSGCVPVTGCVNVLRTFVGHLLTSGVTVNFSRVSASCSLFTLLIYYSYVMQKVISYKSPRFNTELVTFITYE
jgi:hypothetical protein